MSPINLKERFSDHIPEIPINFQDSMLELHLEVINRTTPNPAHKLCLVESELARIVKNLEELYDEGVLRLPKEEVRRKCLEIAVSAVAIINPTDIKAILIDVSTSLLAAKNSDYGWAFAKWGSWGVIIRLWDKVLRVVNLLDKPEYEPKVAESTQDTLKDLAGYAFLLYSLLRDERIKFDRGHA